MQITPVIAIHMAAALAAVAIGPVALWARKGRAQRPRLHRAAGYAWVTLMVAVAVSAIFISGNQGPRLGGFGLIHLLIPVTLGFIALSFYFLLRGNVSAHRRIMQGAYVGSCLVAGAFTLLPNRFLGQWLWTQVGLL
jgi:uncharacterized membrane protein